MDDVGRAYAIRVWVCFLIDAVKGNENGENGDFRWMEGQFVTTQGAASAANESGAIEGAQNLM
jgi:hypothetical protein